MYFLLQNSLVMFDILFLCIFNFIRKNVINFLTYVGGYEYVVILPSGMNACMFCNKEFSKKHHAARHVTTVHQE